MLSIVWVRRAPGARSLMPVGATETDRLYVVYCKLVRKYEFYREFPCFFFF